MAFPSVPPTTSSPSGEVLMDVANTTEEITSRLAVRSFSAIAHLTLKISGGKET